MKALRLHAPGDLRVHDGPLPNCGSGETLVHIKAVGICGSDLHWFSEGSIDDAFAAVLPGGKVILAGIPNDDRTYFSASTARRKGLTIKLVRRMKHTYPRAIELVSKGLVDLGSLVTHRFPLEQAAEAFRVAQRREGLKIIIEV